MPKSLDPNSRLTFVLACDVDKPIETQPQIFARVLTINQQRKLVASMQSMRTDGDTAATFEAALDAAEICLVGWQNMIDPATGEPIPFSRDTIGDVLTVDELVEVFDAVIGSTKPSAGDQKKSE
jgi:uncharacterized Rossmann fold enzyme